MGCQKHSLPPHQTSAALQSNISPFGQTLPSIWTNIAPIFFTVWTNIAPKLFTIWTNICHPISHHLGTYCHKTYHHHLDQYCAKTFHHLERKKLPHNISPFGLILQSYISPFGPILPQNISLPLGQMLSSLLDRHCPKTSHCGPKMLQNL